MPITRVLGADNRMLHDCAEAGCEVSWDGIELATGEKVEGALEQLPAHFEPVDASTVRLTDSRR